VVKLWDAWCRLVLVLFGWIEDAINYAVARPLDCAWNGLVDLVEDLTYLLDQIVTKIVEGVRKCLTR
jgi:hypothetical protein